MISKIVFHFNVGGPGWRIVHYTAAAVSLTLIGVHLGLHVDFIKSVVLKQSHTRKKPAAALGMILTLVITGYGCYSIATTSYVNWLTMPFSASQVQHGPNGYGFGHQGGAALRGSETPGGGGSYQGSSSHMEHRRGGANDSGFMTIIQTIAAFFSISFVFATATYWLDSLFRRLSRQPMKT